MALIQKVGNNVSSQGTEDKVETMMKIAKSVAVDFSSSTTQDQASVITALSNNRGSTLKLYASQSWIGNFNDNPPASISAGGSCQFSHIGSMAAVVYGEDDGQGSSNPSGYLLGWSMDSSATMRVFVECGPLSEVYCNGWESAAEANINNSGSQSSAQDDRTSSTAQAQIQNGSGTFVLGLVGANFT